MGNHSKVDGKYVLIVLLTFVALLFSSHLLPKQVEAHVTSILMLGALAALAGLALRTILGKRLSEKLRNFGVKDILNILIVKPIGLIIFIVRSIMTLVFKIFKFK